MVVTDARDRRADQVRVELLPRDEDLVHQRDREPVRGARRRRADGREGHRHGPAHRLQVPARGAGLRRLLLPQGHARARRRSRARPASTAGIVDATIAANERTRWSAWSRRSSRGVGRRAASASACSGWRSSRTPTTCARRRRSRSSPALQSAAASRCGVRSGGDAEGARELPSCEGVDVRRAMPTRRRAARTRSRIVTEWNEFRNARSARDSSRLMQQAGAVRPAQHLRSRRSRGGGHARTSASAEGARVTAHRRRPRRAEPAGARSEHMIRGRA